GFIDMALGWTNPMAQNPWILLLVGVVMFGIYFVVFRFFILKLDLPTPGREPEDSREVAVASAQGKYAQQASGMIAGLGGAENITSLDNCTTRLRLELADPGKLDEGQLKQAGAVAAVKPGGKSVQVVYGLNVQSVRDAMESIMAGETQAAASEV